MTDRLIILRDERNEDGSHHLRGRLRDDGSLVIEGHDLGAIPQRFWGSDEYEWTITLDRAAVARLIEVLEGAPGQHDPLTILEQRFHEDERYASRAFLEEHGIPFKFWSRVGE